MNRNLITLIVAFILITASNMLFGMDLPSSIPIESSNQIMDFRGTHIPKLIHYNQIKLVISHDIANIELKDDYYRLTVFPDQISLRKQPSSKILIRASELENIFDRLNILYANDKLSIDQLCIYCKPIDEKKYSPTRLNVDARSFKGIFNIQDTPQTEDTFEAYYGFLSDIKPASHNFLEPKYVDHSSPSSSSSSSIDDFQELYEKNKNILPNYPSFQYVDHSSPSSSSSIDDFQELYEKNKNILPNYPLNLDAKY